MIIDYLNDEPSELDLVLAEASEALDLLDDVRPGRAAPDTIRGRIDTTRQRMRIARRRTRDRARQRRAFF